MRKTTVVIVLIGILAFLMSSTLFAVVAFGSGAAAQIQENKKVVTYPLGTVCGDALAGAYSLTKFTGHSNYRGFSTDFTINNLVLSGGASGTVTATGGQVDSIVRVGKVSHELVQATFTHLTGKYTINPAHRVMKVSFTVSELDLSSPVTLHLNDPRLPTISISCSTTDSA